MKNLNLLQQKKLKNTMTEDKGIEKYGEQCMHSTRNTLLPYENDWTCIFVDTQKRRRN